MHSMETVYKFICPKNQPAAYFLFSIPSRKSRTLNKCSS